MSTTDPQASSDTLTRLVDGVRERSSSLTGGGRVFVGSELRSIDRVLCRIQKEGLARGPVFCEWGSGLGGVCGVASLHGFQPLGIEIQEELVDSARSLARELDLPTVFAQGTFLLPGDEDLAMDANANTRLVFEHDAWSDIDLLPEDCDVVFAYPWPGEECFVDGVFERHASPGALLLTFHDFDRVLVQRKLDDDGGMQALGWM